MNDSLHVVLRWRSTVTCLMIFIAVTNVVAITRRYYKLFTKNLVLYKYLLLNIIRFAFYSGIRRAARRVFKNIDKHCSFMHANTQSLVPNGALLCSILRF